VPPTSCDLPPSPRQVEKNIKKMATKDMTGARVLAKSLVGMRNTQNRLYMAKAQMSSIENQLVMQMSQMKAANAMSKSTEVMAAMNKLVKLPEMQDMANRMAMEMDKMGLIEEMMEDTLEMDDVDLDDEAEEEVEKVLASLAVEIAGNGPVVPITPVVVAEEPVTIEAQDPELDEMEARMAMLQS